MKINEIMYDRAGDQQWRADIEQRNAALAGVWIIDRKTAKRLAGPFKDEQKAQSFKVNRPDRIPADAIIKTIQ